MKKELKFRRHGDVNLHPIKEVKGEKVKHNGSFVLAEGETTGHKHVISVPDIKDMDVYRTADGGMILKLKKEGTLTHQEHGTLKIKKGIYFVGKEREKDWFSLSVRKVID